MTGSQVSGERITVDGTVLVRLIYVGEDARVRCFEQNLPFSKYVEVKNLPDSPCVSVRLKAEYVTAARSASGGRIFMERFPSIFP